MVGGTWNELVGGRSTAIFALAGFACFAEICAVIDGAIAIIVESVAGFFDAAAGGDAIAVEVFSAAIVFLLWEDVAATGAPGAIVLAGLVAIFAFADAAIEDKPRETGLCLAWFAFLVGVAHASCAATFGSHETQPKEEASHPDEPFSQCVCCLWFRHCFVSQNL